MHAGYFAFNFQHIMVVSHLSHLSLGHSHRTTAFCAFAGCKTDGTQGVHAWLHDERAPVFDTLDQSGMR